MFQIGSYTIESRSLLAPMAGVTDAPFRRLCRQYGAGLATSEMITSDTRLWDSKKTRSRLSGQSQEVLPVSVQIAGSDPRMMAEAAQQAVTTGAQIIDINMGCPAKKVCRKLAGSALLKDEKLVAQILESVITAVTVPVTLKIRTGWDSDNRNGPAIARMAENIGIAALAVHGRTRACRFNGEAEYDTIAKIAQSVEIPVFANGDINCPEKARKVLDHTGAAAVMIGRGAFGNPWIFQQIQQYLNQGTHCAPPDMKAVYKTLVWHLKELTSFYGELKGVRIARKHVSWYLQRYQNTQHFLQIFNQLDTLSSQLEALQNYFQRPATHEENAA
ncbi:tRNA dihydrouridine synthase DusB [Teredinibacter franksiae]|uniref:tRNA dihydrouridine synthase DusB n=1 Tax=Teredinibacter franksiae TaxID=2761453 RepID=UPI00162A5779|nr:tRNA dihydrouridine synthase DusB [Teredinibacter franksiae]